MASSWLSEISNNDGWACMEGQWIRFQFSLPGKSSGGPCGDIDHRHEWMSIWDEDCLIESHEQWPRGFIGSFLNFYSLFSCLLWFYYPPLSLRRGKTVFLLCFFPLFSLSTPFQHFRLHSTTARSRSRKQEGRMDGVDEGISSSWPSNDRPSSWTSWFLFLEGRRSISFDCYPRPGRQLGR